jgi:putative ABC transport system substrate-binding protein
MMSSGYPVEAGLAQSLRMPGGNVTGNATYVDGKVFGKYLEFLRILSPRLTRLGVLWDYVPPAATTQEAALALSELNRAARALGITVKLREVRGKSDVDHALAGFAKDRVDALFVTSGPVHADPETAEAIIASARRQRIPTMSDFAGGFFTHGGLLVYSPSPAALGRRAAYFVDRILRGARPADLPIEHPSKFDLIINARTARAIGLTIPPALLAQADQIIE